MGLNAGTLLAMPYVEYFIGIVYGVHVSLEFVWMLHLIHEHIS